VFTGLIEAVGTVRRIYRRSDSSVLTICPAGFAVEEIALGDSVAINGACLTVTEIEGSGAGGTFTVLAGAESLRRTTLGDLRVQSAANLERAMRVGDRLGGHLVAGHVDEVGEIVKKRDLGANFEFVFRASAQILRYVVEQGSLTVDGISLTVNRVDDYSFSVALIPHTVEKTSLANKSVGARVNLEVDIIGKYVEKLLGGYTPGKRNGGSVFGGLEV